MIISYEKHLNDFLNREQSLQKIIKTQEQTIQGLNHKLSEKTEHLILPMKMRYESEISLKNREILDLQNKLKETQTSHNDEKMKLSTMLESNFSTNQNLQKQLEFEKQSFSQKTKELEVSLKSQVEILSEENERLFDENKKMRDEIMEIMGNKSEVEILVEELNNLQLLYKEKEADLISENMHYRNEVETLRENFQEQQSLNQKDRRILQKKIDEMLLQVKSHESDMKYEVEQFKEHLRELNKEFAKKNSEVMETKTAKDKIIGELMKDKEDLEHQLNNQREEMLNDLKRKEEIFEKKFELLSREMIIINEEKSNELEKFIREIEILKNEKLVYEKNLEEAKRVLTNKENSMNSELLRQKIALDKLIELGQQREIFLQEDIRNLHESMMNLQKSYESKESMMNDDRGEKRRILETLDKVIINIRNMEDRLGQNKNIDNQRINDLARENKINLMTLNERTKELDKLRSEHFDKKVKEKQVIPQQYEKLSFHLHEINSKLPLLMNYLSFYIEGESNQINLIPEPQKHFEETITPQKPHNDVEILKYEEKIIKNEAELDLAKKSLMMYINHVKELEEQIESINNESNEKLFTQQEVLDLRLEITKLKEENKYLFELNQKLEENIMSSLKKFSRKESINDDSNINSNALVNNSKIFNTTEKKTVKSMKNPNPIVEKERNMDMRRVCRQIVDSLQIVQKNFNNFGSFEGEVVKSLQQTIKIYENRINQYEKVLENDLASMNKRLIFLEDTISDPLGLTQKVLEDLQSCCESLLSEVSNYHSKNIFNQNIWKDFESKIKRSPFLQEGEKNLLYQTEQQTINILRSETNSLYNMIEQDKEKHQKELQKMIQNYEASHQILEEKMDSLKVELDNEKNLKENLKNLLESLKKSQNKELKKLKFELTNVNRFITDKQSRFNEEKKKLGQEIQKYEQVLSQKEQNYKKIYENKLIKFVESIEEKTKTINSKNAQIIQDEAVFRKIEEEKEKKFNIQINLLKDELTNLKEMEKEREIVGQKEKNSLIKINESLQNGLEKLSNDKQKYLDQINSLNELLKSKDSLMKEREKQISIEVYHSKSMRNTN